MLAASPKKNRHRKSDDCSEADPPGKFHGWKPGRLDVSDLAEQSRVKLVASALIAVLREPMAVAKIPAINKPRRPVGILVRMKWQKTSGEFGRLGSGLTW